MDSKMFGNRIKAEREAKGLTQEQLADLINTSPNHLSALERGVKLPRLDTFVAIANALDISSDVLLYGAILKSYHGKACSLSEDIEKMPQESRVRVLNIIEAIIKYQ